MSPIAVAAVPPSSHPLAGRSCWATAQRSLMCRPAARNSADPARAPASCPPVAGAPQPRRSRRGPFARLGRYPPSRARTEPHCRCRARAAGMPWGCSRRGRRGSEGRQSMVVACGKLCIERPCAKRGVRRFICRPARFLAFIFDASDQLACWPSERRWLELPHRSGAAACPPAERDRSGALLGRGRLLSGRGA